jgi:hypothetical protein
VETPHTGVKIAAWPDDSTSDKIDQHEPRTPNQKPTNPRMQAIWRPNLEEKKNAWNLVLSSRLPPPEGLQGRTAINHSPSSSPPANHDTAQHTAALIPRAPGNNLREAISVRRFPLRPRCLRLEPATAAAMHIAVVAASAQTAASVCPRLCNLLQHSFPSSACRSAADPIPDWLAGPILGRRLSRFSFVAKSDTANLQIDLFRCAGAAGHTCRLCRSSSHGCTSQGFDDAMLPRYGYSVHSTGLEQSSCTPTPGRHTASASASVALPSLELSLDSRAHRPIRPPWRELHSTMHLRKLIVSE